MCSIHSVITLVSVAWRLEEKKKIKICPQALTSPTQLQNRSFHVECKKNEIVLSMPKVLLFHVKYEKLNFRLRPYNLPSSDQSRSVADRDSYLTPSNIFFFFFFFFVRYC